MTKANSLTEAILETAQGMHGIGVLGRAGYEKITLRHLGVAPGPAADPISADEIRAMREQANVSQAVFARYLNLTVGYVSQLERGARRPTGPALALLNVIRRKGLEVMQ